MDSLIDNLTDKDLEDYNRNDFKRDCPKYNYFPTMLPEKKRIIAIGDLHGDFKLTVDCLKLSKVIDNDLNWVGGDTVVVQVGDQIDSCRPIDLKCNNPLATDNDKPDDMKILKFFTELDEKARKDGGMVYSLLGNHELMNSLGNMNYVSYKNIESFNKNEKEEDPAKIYENGYRERVYQFAPGNEIGKFLGCSRIATVIIGNFLFIHAGIIPEFVKLLNIKTRYDLIKINHYVRKWLLKQVNKDNVRDIVESNKYSPFWDRILGSIPHNASIDYDKQCSEYLKPVLNIFNIDAMIIGHTPQFSHGINSTCNSKLWRIDHGGSEAFNKFVLNESVNNLRKAQVLEIITENGNSSFNILKTSETNNK